MTGHALEVTHAPFPPVYLQQLSEAHPLVLSRHVRPWGVLFRWTDAHHVPYEFRYHTDGTFVATNGLDHALRVLHKEILEALRLRQYEVHLREVHGRPEYRLKLRTLDTGWVTCQAASGCPTVALIMACIQAARLLKNLPVQPQRRVPTLFGWFLYGLSLLLVLSLAVEWQVLRSERLTEEAKQQARLELLARCQTGEIAACHVWQARFPPGGTP